MGQENSIRAARPLLEALAAFAAEGHSLQIVMVDGQLVLPAAPVPQAWTEVRLRSSAGMLTARQSGGGVSVVVFGNAEAALLAVRDRLAAAFGGNREG